MSNATVPAITGYRIFSATGTNADWKFVKDVDTVDERDLYVVTLNDTESDTRYSATPIRARR